MHRTRRAPGRAKRGVEGVRVRTGGGDIMDGDAAALVLFLLPAELTNKELLRMASHLCRRPCHHTTARVRGLGWGLEA